MHCVGTEKLTERRVLSPIFIECAALFWMDLGMHSKNKWLSVYSREVGTLCCNKRRTQSSIMAWY